MDKRRQLTIFDHQVDSSTRINPVELASKQSGRVVSDTIKNDKAEIYRTEVSFNNTTRNLRLLFNYEWEGTNLVITPSNPPKDREQEFEKLVENLGRWHSSTNSK
jgi:hypothetical protein